MNLYLVRHGATLENERKCYLGWTDAELSPQGTRQAEHLAAYFQGRPLLSIYCSDLKRTTRTAEIIGSRHGLKPEA
ncbi:MAG TPA: histidine phosphatase family protein, partial [Firmicutes bacterium]|nr:histidine phosphatase family protein [Bacillota bacterium]